MRIVLKNFRCWANREFVFPDKGLICISGDRGTGKSTILRGIFYALYGKLPGKVKTVHPLDNENVASSVLLEYMGLEIVRTTKPKNCTVKYKGSEYVGDAAENIIYTRLRMNFEEFIASGYLYNRHNASILSLTPAEQLKFLEGLMETDTSDYLNRIKKDSKETSSQIQIIQGQISTLDSVLQRKNINLENLPTDKEVAAKRAERTSIEQRIDELKSSSQTMQKEHDRFVKELDRHRAKYATARSKHEKNMKTNSNIEILQEKQSKIEEVFSPESIDRIKKEIYQLKETRKKQIAYNEYSAKLKTLEESRKNHVERMTRKRQELAKNLVTEENIKKMEEELSEKRQYEIHYNIAKTDYDNKIYEKQECVKKLSKLFKEIHTKYDITKNCKNCASFCKILDRKRSNVLLQYREKQLEKQKLQYNTCPKCSCKFYTNENGENEILGSKNKNKISLESITQDLQIIKTELDLLEEYISQLQNLSKLNKKHTFDMTEPENIAQLELELIRARKNLDDWNNSDPNILPDGLAEHISRLQQSQPEAVSFDPLIDNKISQLEEQLIGQTSLARERDECIKGISRLNKMIDNGNDNLPELEKTINTVQNTITKLARLLAGINTEREELMTRKEELQTFLTTIENVNEIKEIKRDLRRNKRTLTGLENRLNGLQGLAEVISSAKCAMVMRFAVSINEHARMYLDQLFSDPISVKLSCNTSKTTAQLKMHTSIIFRGKEYKDYEELSDGERQSIDLAFRLALNSIYENRLIIFDESFNNLDATNNLQSIQNVKRFCASKLALVISHEAVRGVFDKEINLNLA